MAASAESREKPISRIKLVVQLLVALLVGTIAALAIIYVPPAGWTSNEVITGKHPGYPNLKSRVYDMQSGHCILFAAEAARRLGWQVLETDRESGTLHATAPGFPIPLKDEITVTALPDPSNPRHTVVEIRSRSSYGPGDLGANARHIRDLQGWMDDKLPAIQ